ncbi:MAG TPA: hypothetical protein DEF42_13065 [Desulfosporosinus sp.]|nr:hypothetical protein [Desulfosporosinus sp.]
MVNKKFYRINSPNISSVGAPPHVEPITTCRPVCLPPVTVTKGCVAEGILIAILNFTHTPST